MGKNRRGDTAERILVAATIHFAERGFDGTRMETIAKTAQVNKATIYYHLGDKKALYTAVLHRVISKQATHIAQQIESADSSQDQLRAVIRGLRQLIEEEPHISAIIMHEMLSGGRHLPPELVHDIARLVGLTYETLVKGRRANQFIAAHPMVVYLMVVSPMAYYEKMYSNLHNQLVAGSRGKGFPVISFKDFADQLEALVLNALKP